MTSKEGALPQETQTENERIKSALSLAIQEKTSSKDLGTDWTQKPEAITYLEKESGLFDYLQFAGVFFKGKWDSRRTSAALIELDDIARKAKLIKYGDKNVFSPILRHLEQKFQIRTTSLPKDIFHESVVILETGKTSKQVLEQKHKPSSGAIITENDIITLRRTVPGIKADTKINPAK